ncbi:MAG: helix-turn-helix transcriptional regulator [Paracoccaceae bacterium]
MANRLCDEIRGRRLSRGLSRGDLAHKVGVEEQTVGRWERGGMPDAKVFPAIRQVLDIPLAIMDDVVIKELQRQDHILRVEGHEYLERVGTSYLEMVREIFDLDKGTIGYHQTYDCDPVNWVPFFEKFPHCWRNMSDGSRIVGNWQFIPIKKKAFDLAKSGKLAEVDITDDHTQDLDWPGNYYAYLAALVCEPRFRIGRRFKDFFDSMFECLLEMAKAEVFIKEIVCAAWTPESVRVCEKLKLKEVGQLDKVEREVPVYHGNMIEILQHERFEGHDLLVQLYKGED